MILSWDLMTFLREAAGIVSPRMPYAAGGLRVAVPSNSMARLLSCVTKMGKVDDGAVTTTEGLGTYRQNVYANAFVQCGGVQCGFLHSGHCDAVGCVDQQESGADAG